MKDKKILIVEDDPSVADLYRERIEIENASVILVSDGAEAITKINTEKFDLILLDVMMPKLGGLDVLDAIRVKGPNQGTKVIILTALIDERYHKESFIRGADLYLIKTKITPKELVETIKNIL